jgi:fumarate hydratase class II
VNREVRAAHGPARRVAPGPPARQADRCARDIEPNEDHIRQHLDNSLMLVTALNPHIGYEKAAQISLKAYREDLTLREAALSQGFVTAEQFQEWIRPEDMTHPLASRSGQSGSCSHRS